MYEDITDDILIEEIADIELRLRELKLQLEERRDRRRNPPSGTQRAERGLRVGDKVRITNPRPFQEREGTVTKVNPDTDFVTIQGNKKKGKVSRKSKNVIKIEEFSS